MNVLAPGSHVARQRSLHQRYLLKRVPFVVRTFTNEVRRTDIVGEVQVGRDLYKWWRVSPCYISGPQGFQKVISDKGEQ
jgi:hypothetical protein